MACARPMVVCNFSRILPGILVPLAGQMQSPAVDVQILARGRQVAEAEVVDRDARILISPSIKGLCTPGKTKRIPRLRRLGI